MAFNVALVAMLACFYGLVVDRRLWHGAVWRMGFLVLLLAVLRMCGWRSDGWGMMVIFVIVWGIGEGLYVAERLGVHRR